MSSSDPAVQALEYATFLVARDDDADAAHSAAKRAGQRTAAVVHDDAAAMDVVVVVLNQRDETAQFELALGEHAVTVTLQPHTIQTLTLDAALLKLRQ